MTVPPATVAPTSLQPTAPIIIPAVAIQPTNQQRNAVALPPAVTGPVQSPSIILQPVSVAGPTALIQPLTPLTTATTALASPTITQSPSPTALSTPLRTVSPATVIPQGNVPIQTPAEASESIVTPTSLALIPYPTAIDKMDPRVDKILGAAEKELREIQLPDLSGLKTDQVRQWVADQLSSNKADVHITSMLISDILEKQLSGGTMMPSAVSSAKTI
jgi:hypothetical protein